MNYMLATRVYANVDTTETLVCRSPQGNTLSPAGETNCSARSSMYSMVVASYGLDTITVTPGSKQPTNHWSYLHKVPPSLLQFSQTRWFGGLCMNQTLSFIFFFVPGISDYDFSVPHVTWNGLDAGSAFPYSARSRASLT